MSAITLAQLHAEARARFGPRQAGWAYRCPVCGHVATGPDIAWMLSQQPAETAARFPARVDQVLARWCLRCGATADEYGTTTVTLPDGQTVRVFDLAAEDQ